MFQSLRELNFAALLVLHNRAEKKIDRMEGDEDSKISTMWLVPASKRESTTRHNQKEKGCLKCLKGNELHEIVQHAEGCIFDDNFDNIVDLVLKLDTES